jgi:uncharacterized protein YbjT (DUF2867 family)
MTATTTATTATTATTRTGPAAGSPARVLVTGGTGSLGREAVPRLIAAGYTVRVQSRRARPPQAPPAVEWATADLGTGEGVAASLADVDVVLHAATSPFRREREVDVAGTRRLAEAGAVAGVSSLVYISIVGIDRPPLAGFPYYRAKLAAEAIVQEGRLPWTILRATQFHDLIDRLLGTLLRLPVGLLPRGFVFQTVDAGVVADRLVECIVAGPRGRVPDVGGPAILTLDAMARAWRRHAGRRGLTLPLTLPFPWAAGYRAGLNTAPDHRAGGPTWEEWLRRRYGAPSAA